MEYTNEQPCSYAMVLLLTTGGGAGDSVSVNTLLEILRIRPKITEGNEFDLGGRDVVSLCRCGQSANKPFCDGSHRTTHFVSTEKARSLPPKT